MAETRRCDRPIRAATSDWVSFLRARSFSSSSTLFIRSTSAVIRASAPGRAAISAHSLSKSLIASSFSVSRVCPASAVSWLWQAFRLAGLVLLRGARYAPPRWGCSGRTSRASLPPCSRPPVESLGAAGRSRTGSAVPRPPSRPAKFLEVVTLRSLDPVGVGPAERGPVALQESSQGHHPLLRLRLQASEPGGELLGGVHLPRPARAR